MYCRASLTWEDSINGYVNTIDTYEKLEFVEKLSMARHSSR